MSAVLPLIRKLTTGKDASAGQVCSGKKRQFSVTDVFPVTPRISLVHSFMSIRYPSTPVSASFGVTSSTSHFAIVPLKFHQARYQASYTDVLERHQRY